MAQSLVLGYGLARLVLWLVPPESFLPPLPAKPGWVLVKGVRSPEYEDLPPESRIAKTEM